MTPETLGILLYGLLCAFVVGTNLWAFWPRKSARKRVWWMG